MQSLGQAAVGVVKVEKQFADEDTGVLRPFRGSVTRYCPKFKW